jgi:hypothetical protein
MSANFYSAILKFCIAVIAVLVLGRVCKVAVLQPASAVAPSLGTDCVFLPVALVVGGVAGLCILFNLFDWQRPTLNVLGWVLCASPLYR